MIVVTCTFSRHKWVQLMTMLYSYKLVCFLGKVELLTTTEINSISLQNEVKVQQSQLKVTIMYQPNRQLNKIPIWIVLVETHITIYTEIYIIKIISQCLLNCNTYSKSIYIVQLFSGFTCTR